MNNPRKSTRGVLPTILGIALLGLGVVLLIVGLFAIIAVVLMLAWAGFMVPVLGLPLLSFPEAFSAVMLLFLLRLMLMRVNRASLR